MYRALASLTSLLLLTLILPRATQAVELEELGNFLEPHFDDPEQKRLTDDIRFFHGRLYIAYGYTNTKTDHQLIWYDLATGEFRRELKPDGQPRTWPIEKTYKLRIFDNELFVVDYDPIHGKSNLIRITPDFQVRTQKVSTDAHNRDVARFDGTLFLSHGRNDVPWPQMRWSHDDGESWQQIDQSAEFAENSLHENFFVWRDRLYAGTHSTRLPEGARLAGKSMEEILSVLEPQAGVPWLITSTGERERPWEPVAMRPEEVLPPHPERSDPRGNQVVQYALEAGEELIVVAGGQSYALRSWQAADNHPLTLGPEISLRDLEHDPQGQVWALACGPYDQTTKRGPVLLLRYADGAWHEGLRLSLEHYPRCMAFTPTHCYLGFNRGRLARLALPEAPAAAASP